MKDIKLIIILVCAPLLSQAQYFNPNDNLRSVFGGLTFKNPSAPTQYDFLYQMSAHYIDDVYYNPIVNDTSDLSKYFYMYESMYYSAKDTTQWEVPDDYVDRASVFFADTNVLVLLNFDFLDIKDVALNTPGYFVIDTVNQKFLDHPSPVGDPFDVREVFAAAFMNENQQFLNCTYRIDPALMHFDPNNQYKDDDYEGVQLRIDFGDGNGWVYFDQSQVSHHQVSYSNPGHYSIQIEFYMQGSTINRAVVNKRIIGDSEYIAPDETISIIPGIRAGVYNGCADGLQPVEDRKTIIYLEGIDILDFVNSSNRGVSDIYQWMIKYPKLVELRNFGYNFVVVDWVNSRRDMKLNALSVVALIDYLKCQYQESEHEFVVVGESMGGLIGRYALTFMETEEYINGYTVTSATNIISNGPSYFVEPCKPELMHKTRLFITIDSPHQGANVPLAYQELYKYGANSIFGGKWFSPYIRKYTTDIADLFLGSDAAKQMLIYHADSKTGFNTIADEWYYYPHSKKTAFFKDLNGIGNVPRYCKTMALSNGSLDGQGQSRPYDGQLRTANDILLDFEGDIYARVLGAKVKVFGAALEMHTNPNGYGRILETSAGTWGIKVKLHWFGLSVKTGLISWFYHDIKAGNTKPWCTEAGGIYGGSLPDLGGPSGNVNLWPNENLSLFQNVSSNDGNGNYSFSAEFGIPWVASGGAELGFYSDGLHFDFIPVASALNWGVLDGNGQLSPDIIGEPWPNKVENSSFDVIAGVDQVDYYPVGPGVNSYFNIYHANRSHLTVLNPIILPRLTNCNLYSYVLNREIGDEILYLNNRKLVYSSRFEAELDLIVNSGNNNPHYTYAAGPGLLLPLKKGFFSKAEPFVMEAQPYFGTPGVGHFKYENQFVNNTPVAPPAQVFEIRQPLWICCYPYSYYKAGNITPSVDDELRNALNLEVSISPNPTNDRIIVKLSGDLFVLRSYSLNSVDGKILTSGEINSKSNAEFNVDLGDCPQGIYIHW